MIEEIDENILEKLKEEGDDLDVYMYLIGHIVYYFNILEGYLNDSISFLINKDEQNIGFTIVTDKAYSEKIILFDRLAQVYMQKHGINYQDALKNTIEELRNSGTKRNETVHSFWHTYDPSVKKINVKLKFKKSLPAYSSDYISIHTFIENIKYISEAAVGIAQFKYFCLEKPLEQNDNKSSSIL